MRLRRNPFPGLDPGATIRECLHYRRYGTWPASYIARLIREGAGGISTEDAELMADLGNVIVGDLKREMRR
jgi:hypothetical protein